MAVFRLMQFTLHLDKQRVAAAYGAGILQANMIIAPTAPEHRPCL